MSDNTDNDQTVAADAVDDAGEPKPSDAVNDEPQDDPDAQDDPETADDDTSDRRRGVRQRLADTEAERDGLLETLKAQRQAVFDAALHAAGIDPRLLVSAGQTVDSLIDADGILHSAAVTEAASAAADDFGIQRSRRPAPDPLVGGGGGNGPAPKGFGDVLKSVVRGTG